MIDRALPALFVILVWWAATAAVLRTVWLARAWRPFTMVLATVLAVAGLVGLYVTSRQTTAASAYLAFVSALAVWAWHELTFLLGVVTGSRKEPCPPGANGWNRFRLATEAVIHHELALAATVVVIAALTWGTPNATGAATFYILWVMRLSAKLNVFLGVRNVTEHFVPEHLRYLLSYFRRARLNVLMPFSLAGSVAGVVWLVSGSSVALGSDAADCGTLGRVLLATLAALAAIEHLFLALPLPDAWLWSWIIRDRRVHEPPPDAALRHVEEAPWRS
ncbi:MAG: DUF3623 domain-containing protein [Deltaproteobacteria bacterium]|nr:DUF3623 domain-containing protein [Deltaproteobacteria bacterium]